MAYYYLTECGKIYKSSGARKVRRILADPKFIKTFTAQQTVESGIIYAPYIPVMKMEPVVQIQSRKISAKWTVEDVQDIQAMHGIDLSSELSLLDEKKYWSKRNIIPIDVFKSNHMIVCETSDFNMIIFELAMREL